MVYNGGNGFFNDASGATFTNLDVTNLTGTNATISDIDADQIDVGSEISLGGGLIECANLNAANLQINSFQPQSLLVGVATITTASISFIDIGTATLQMAYVPPTSGGAGALQFTVFPSTGGSQTGQISVS